MSNNGRLAAFRTLFWAQLNAYWTIFARLQNYYSHHGLFGCLSQHRIAFEAIAMPDYNYFELLNAEIGQHILE